MQLNYGFHAQFLASIAGDLVSPSYMCSWKLVLGELIVAEIFVDFVHHLVWLWFFKIVVIIFIRLF